MIKKIPRKYFSHISLVKMISCKGFYGIIALLNYSILIGLFIRFSKEVFEENCSLASPCVRFCSEEKSDDYLWNKFSKTSLYLKHFNTSGMCQIYRGKPSCKDLISVEAKGGTYDFTPVSKNYKFKS